MSNKRFIETYTQGTMSTFRIIVDTETGVNYLVNSSNCGGGITVLLDKEGKPLITPSDRM